MDKLFMFFPGFKKKALTLSYDDGVKFDKRLIEIMSAHGLKGTFNICGGFLSPTDGQRHLSGKEVFEMLTTSGNEVANHGQNHYSLTCMPEPLALADVLDCRRTLEKLFNGKPITGMAYANGSFNDRVVELLRACGITYCRTTRSTGGFAMPENFLQWHPTCHHKDARLMEFLDTFLAWQPPAYFWGDKAQLFYLWGHSYEFDNDNNWEVIEEFAKKAGGRDDVWYATNGEICRYCQAFERLECSADGVVVHNPTNVDIYFDYYKKPVLIPAGKTVHLKEGREV